MITLNSSNPIIADPLPPTVYIPILDSDVETLMRAIAHQGEITRQLTAQASGLYEEIANLRWNQREMERRLGLAERRAGRRGVTK